MKLLSTILEEYTETHDPALIEEFKQMLWESKLKPKKRKLSYKYKVVDSLLQNDSELIGVFDKHKKVEYFNNQNRYSYDELEYIDFIRIRVNNLYAYHFDSELYLDKEYYRLLSTAANKYYEVIGQLKQDGNIHIDTKEIDEDIKRSFDLAEQVKTNSPNKKMTLTWDEYVKLVNGWIDHLFDLYKTPERYEQEHGWEYRNEVIFTEENWVINYFNKSIKGKTLNYIRDSMPKYIVCDRCGKELEVKHKNTKYCEACLKERTKERRKVNNSKYYMKNKK